MTTRQAGPPKREPRIDRIQILAKVGQITDKDILEFRKDVLADLRKIFDQSDQATKSSLALMNSLEDETLAALLEVQYMPGIHDIRNLIHQLAIFTGSERFEKLIDEAQK